MKILAIETSCDETSAAVVEGNRGKVRILSNIVSSQIDIHKKYGGVVPEVAARNHILNIIQVMRDALGEEVNTPSTPPCLPGRQVKRGDVDLIAVTGGPGLMSSLLIGAQAAETLAYVWEKPLIIINHIEGHIFANWLAPISKSKVNPASCLRRQASAGQKSKIRFPVLALVVSGGHTQLVLMRDHLKYKTIGQTRDDAAGEAFDKVAKMLGLGYPGGPIISKMATLKHPVSPLRQAPSNTAGWHGMLFAKGGGEIRLPRPMINSNDFDFSFSGLKTAVLYLVKNLKHTGENVVPAICAEFQQAVIDVLIAKTIKVAQKYKVKSVLLAGGVAANKELRKQLGEAIKDELSQDIIYHVPEQNLCTDNAAMIGAAAYYRYLTGQCGKVPPAGRIKVDPNWHI